jgi:hypothetical protein
MVLDHIKGFFCIYWDDQVVFVFASINVLYYVCRFAYVEPSLHFWDKSDFVMVNDLSDVLLDSVWHYFIEDFFINVHWADWPIVLLFGGVFVWLWDECNTGFIKEVRQSSFPFYFMENLRTVGISSSLKGWQNSAENPSGPGLFFFGRYFIAASISSCGIHIYSGD